MRVNWLNWSLICLLASGLAGQPSETAPIRQPSADSSTESAGPTRSPLEPLYSRQTTFMIPFTAESSGSLPTEVQLMVSGDRGATWQWYASRKPDEKQFQFKAARDGEVWFASRTVSVEDRKKPATGLKPELLVRIDTTKPRVEFQCEALASGGIQANWKIFDENLDPQSLRIDHQAGVGQRWISVNFSQSSTDTGSLGNSRTTERAVNSTRELSGKTSWSTEPADRFVDVRLEVRDLAGNREIISRRVFQSSSGKRNSTSDPPGVSPLQPPSDPLAQRNRPKGIPWPIDNRKSGLSQLNDLRGPASTKLSNDATRFDSSADRGLKVESTNLSSSDLTASDLGQDRYDRVEGAVRPPVTQQTSTDRNVFVDSVRPDDPLDSPATRGGPPSGEIPNMTNSKRFNLDYDLESVGPSGVKEVELWSTRDGGGTWVKWGIDADLKSPFLVEVQEEGLYGFRMVVVGGTGLASTRPRAGDMADIWVMVDLTKPVCRITSAIYGAGSHAGQLDIRWEASDSKLKERPVTLYYAAQPNGPWEIIADGLPNSGQHNWTVPGNVPPEVFLKINVRDEAGNVGSFAVERAVSIEALAPKGRIRAVTPTTSRKPTGVQPR